MRIFINGLFLFTRVEAREMALDVETRDESPKTRFLEKTFLYRDCVNLEGRRGYLLEKEYFHYHFDGMSWFMERADYAFKKKEFGSPWVSIDRVEYDVLINENDAENGTAW